MGVQEGSCCPGLDWGVPRSVQQVRGSTGGSRDGEES